MTQTSRQAKARVADTPNDLSENPGVPGQHETGTAGRETHEQAQQDMPASGLLGPAGCLGVLSGTAWPGEMPDQPEGAGA